MKIYFDARMIDHPGIGRYIRCLLAPMATDRSIDLCLLGNREKIKKFLPFQSKIIDFDYPIYSVQEQLGYLGIKGKVKRDILHIPHYNIPVLARFNLVSTIHDIMHITYPEGASGRLAPIYMRFMVERILNTAKAVICVSQATKSEIIRKFSRNIEDLVNRFPSTIERPSVKTVQDVMGESPFLNVIYEGVDRIFTKITDSGYLKSIKEKYNLPDKFLLYVGSIRRHKNIDTLLGSFSQFKKRMPDIRLVMVGRLSQEMDIKRDGVAYLGEIESDRELAAIYNLASCLFNLSLCEGFGLTILEAQKCGLPVVCSDIPVHREVGADGIVPVEPSYIDQVCDNLYNILSNKDAREALISRGFKNTARFDWHKAAQDTIGLYRRICDEGSDSSRLASGDARRRENPQCLL